MHKSEKKKKRKKVSESSQKKVAISIICVLAVFTAVLTEGVYSFVFADQDATSTADTSASSTGDDILSKAKKISSAPPISKKSESKGESSEETDDTTSGNTLVKDKEISSSDVLKCMQDGLASAFVTLSDEQWKELSSVITSLSHEISFNMPSSVTPYKRALLHVALSKAAIDKELFADDALIVVKTYMNDALEYLKAKEGQKYSKRKYKALSHTSLQFSRKHKNADLAVPNQVIFYNQSFILNYPLVNYNDRLMIALDDIYQFIDTSGCYIDSDSLTLSVVSDSVRAEYVPGKTEVYINDKSSVMDVPLLYINETYYMPINFFAQAYSVAYTEFEDNDGDNAVILYDNLNQLESSTVPNKLVFDKTTPTSSKATSSDSSSSEDENGSTASS